MPSASTKTQYASVKLFGLVFAHAQTAPSKAHFALIHLRIYAQTHACALKTTAQHWFQMYKNKTKKQLKYQIEHENLT